jgi:dynein heavy chain
MKTSGKWCVDYRSGCSDRAWNLFFIYFKWFDSDSPERGEFPFKIELNPFQRLMLLRCFRVDRVYLAVTDYVATIMSEQFVTPPVISFESIWEQSTTQSPIVFILSPGSDPTTDLLKLAERSNFGVNRVKLLAMGQGQQQVCFLSSP